MRLSRSLGTLALVFAIAVSTVPPPPPAAAAAGFDDVPAGQFYTDAVDWLVSAEITQGTSDTTFSPNAPVTRAQMAAFLSRYAQIDGDPGEHGFVDVPAGVYYDGPVSFLVDRGITTGTTETTYSPADRVTRAQMATFLWRFSNQPPTDAPNPFDDVPAGQYYTQAVQWLANKGITTGTTPTTFDPSGTVTRAQMATFLWRLAGEPAAGDLGLNRVDTDTTVIADEDDATIVAYDPDGVSTLTWTGDESEAPAVGEVLMMEPSDANPDGLLVEVTGVAGDTIEAIPTTIERAIPQGEFEAVVELEADDGSGPLRLTDTDGRQPLHLTGAIQDAFENAEFECTGGSAFTLTPGLVTTPEFHMSGSWGIGKPLHIEIGMSLTIETSVTAAAEAAVSCEASITIDGPQLRSFLVPIGPVTVPIYPELSLEGRVYVNLGGSLSVTWTNTDTVGITLIYHDGDWSTDIDPLGDGTTTTTTDVAAEAVFGLELRPRLDLKAFGRNGPGPYLVVGPFFEFTAQLDDPWWSIDLGLRATFGAQFQTAFWDVDVRFPTLEFARTRLANAPEGQAPPEDFVQTSALETWKSDAGSFHGCALAAAGGVVCWGSNAFGAIGDGSGVNQARPVWVNTISNELPIDISASLTHSCAVFADGSAECWGSNASGQLGNGTTTYSPTPVKVDIDGKVRDIEAGEAFTCAILEDFSMWCWGENGTGQLGIGSTSDTSTPRRVTGIPDVIQASTGAHHTCAVDVNEHAWCWGDNGAGRLGIDDGTVVWATTPQAVVIGSSAASFMQQVGAGDRHTCFIRAYQAYCVGEGLQGQLGNGEFANSSNLRTVVYATRSLDLGIGSYHGCVANEDQTARCWGYGWDGQLSGVDNTSVSESVQVLGSSKATEVSAGENFSCGQYDFGVTRCWGENGFGQLGNATTTDSVNPVNVAPPN